jgi:hypothetical protein
MILEKLVGLMCGRETDVLGGFVPSAALSTTDLTWLESGSNPVRGGGKPATICLSYITALVL